MKRRNFLIWGSLLGLSPYVEAKEHTTFAKRFENVKPVIEAVQTHMFPEDGLLPSAKAMNAIQFLFESVVHKSYDRDIRTFVVEGAEELISREKGKFVTLSSLEKEWALRAFEETSYGRNWLSRIMTLTMEGLFSAPVYGANKKEAGWKALHAYGGEPRPTVRYIEL